MLRTTSLALVLMAAATTTADAQAVNPTPGTEAAQTNGLLGGPTWILIGAIVAFAVLYALRARRHR